MIDFFTILITIDVVVFGIWWAISVVLGGRISNGEAIYPYFGYLLGIPAMLCISLTTYLMTKIDERRRKFTSVRVMARRF
jgi:hypothetical protein